MLDRAWCAAVVTAAGASSRMGRPKALVELGGVPLLARQLAALTGFGQRLVVLGAHAEAIRAGVHLSEATVVDNPAWPSGRSSSLRCGFAAVSSQARAVVVAGVDQPIDAAVVDALLAAFDPATHACALPIAGDRRGHPALLNAALLDPHLRHLPDDSTLRDVLARFADATLEVPVQSAVTLANLNSEADVVALARELS